MPGALRNTGIEPVGDRPWGTHFCHFYETTDELLETLLPFFKAGLESNELCAWVVSEPLNEDAAWRALNRAVPNFDRYVSDHSIEVLNAREVYLTGGEIVRHRIMGHWNTKLQGALSRRFHGIRVSGDTAWLEQKQWANFLEYEAQVNRDVIDHQMLLLCTYRLRTKSASDFLDVARTHQFAIAKRRGRWEVFERPGQRPPNVSASAEYVSRARRPPLGMRSLRALITRTFARLAGSARHADYTGRCSHCGRGFVVGAPLRWCVTGHKIHQTCVKDAMEREICPICGIYVSERPS